MKVYRLKPDYSYAGFYTWDPGGRNAEHVYSSDLTAIGGSRRAASWEPLTLYPNPDPDEPGLVRGNFMHLVSLNFAIDDHALAVLRPLLDKCCELLPLAPYEGEVFHLINVLDCVDCLDKEKTKWLPFRDDSGGAKRSEGSKGYAIDEYAFDAGSLPTSALFRIPEESHIGEFTVSGLLPPHKEFKLIVESEGLTGLAFEELWSEDAHSGGMKERFGTALRTSFKNARRS